MVLKDKRLLPLAIVAFAVLVFIVLKLTRPEQALITPQERIWYVDAIVADPKSLSPSLTLYGQVETPDLMKAAAPSESQVEEILVREGAAITQGQLLLRLDARDFEPALIQKEAQVAELEAMISSEELRHSSDKQAFQHEKSLLKLSKAAVERAEKMKTKNLGSEAALDQAHQEMERQNLLLKRKLSLKDHKARLNQLNARLKKAQADLSLAQLDLDRSQIYAPFDGYISEIKVANGDRVNANQQLLSMYPSDTLEVRALIPNPYQAELQAAMSNGNALQAKAHYADLPVTLVLDRFSGAASSRGIDGLFRVTEGANLLRVGNSLGLHLSRPQRKNAVALPYTALYERNKLYKLADGRMQGIHVKNLGDYLTVSGNTMLLVSSPDIQSGDKIVTTHLPNAVNGLRVEARNLESLTNTAKIAPDSSQADAEITQ